MAQKEFINHQPLIPDESKIRNEISCRALNCILIYVEEVYGTKTLEKLVEKTGMSIDYLRDQNNWVSWSYYCHLLETLEKETGDTKAAYKAGTFSGHKKSWGYLYYIFYAIGNVGMVIKKGIEIVQHFNKVADWTLLSLQKNKCTFRVKMKEGYLAKRTSCDCRMGQAAGISKAFGMPMGKTRELQCQALGADSCICEVSWLNRPQRIFGFTGLALGCLLILILREMIPGETVGFVESLFILFTGFLGGTLLDYRLTQKENTRINQEQTDALEESVKIIEDKYMELKRAHDGLFAVHEISQAVTSTLRLDDILKILLQMVVERLGFDRSIVLLADGQEGVLQDGRVYGDDSLKVFIHELKIPLNINSPVAEMVIKKRIAQVVTSEIIDRDEIPDLGRKIYDMTGTREYIAVPLVSKGRLMGILVADNVRSNNKITEREKVLMVSLANQVAMAIENARSFQTIEDLNINLEKKVEDRTRELENSLHELKAAQEQLIHSEKMSSLGLLVTGLTHEINNPINFAYNGIAALRKSIHDIDELSRQYVLSAGEVSAEDADKAKDKLAAIAKEAERLMEIIDTGLSRTRSLVTDLKHFSRKDRRDPEFFLIKYPLQSALTILNHEIAGRITVHKELLFTDRIQGYPDQLNQVVLNVLHNAIQAIPKQGNIWIYTETSDANHVQIRIRDDGIGIRAEDLPKVFEPFFTTKKSGQGTGLGMSICRRILDNHGGTIELKSDVGKGTEVIITLPLRLVQSDGRGEEPLERSGIGKN